MPNWYPSYTECSQPKAWYRVTVTQTVVAGILSALGGAGLAILLGPPGAVIGLIAMCIAAIVFCRWWLNVRLICLGGDRSAIGAIYHLEPPVAGEFYSLADYDTDYSFNLLLWPFVPSDELPQSFVDNQWSSAARAQLIADWPTLFPTIPWSGEVPAQVDLILPQQPMATLGLGMAGQDAPHDEPVPQPATAPFQHFLMHCEIEGPGMHELLRLLYMLLAGLVFVLAASALPGVGWIITGILALLALLLAALGGNAIMNEQATPPQGGKWGGSFNSYEDADGDGGPVDIAYVVGRFVYDSFHIGSESNELHPVHFMIKLKTRHPVTKGDIAGGKWPPGLGEQKAKLDAQFQIINSPATTEVQRRPENRWKLHPLLDGCLGETPYPIQPPGGVIL